MFSRLSISSSTVAAVTADFHGWFVLFFSAQSIGKIIKRNVVSNMLPFSEKINQPGCPAFLAVVAINNRNLVNLVRQQSFLLAARFVALVYMNGIKDIIQMERKSRFDFERKRVENVDEDVGGLQHRVAILRALLCRVARARAGAPLL